MKDKQQTRIWPDTMASTKHSGRAPIVLSSRIEVGSRRMLYALSIPEYIEAWLSAPEPEEVLVFAHVTPVRFQIDVYREDARSASIHGSALVASKTQVTYCWKTISPYATTHTVVDFVLFGGVNECVVGLTHSGFGDTRERTWHYEMWKRSMGKLSEIVAAH